MRNTIQTLKNALNAVFNLSLHCFFYRRRKTKKKKKRSLRDTVFHHYMRSPQSFMLFVLFFSEHSVFFGFFFKLFFLNAFLHYLYYRTTIWGKLYTAAGEGYDHMRFAFLNWLESQSNPSYNPSPLVAHVACMYQFRLRNEWRPSLSVISAAFIAFGKSCKQKAK